MPWKAFFATFGAPAFDTVNVTVPGYVVAYDAQLAATPMRRVAGIPSVPRRRRLRGHPARTLRGRELRLPQRRAAGRQGAVAALAALHGRDRRDPARRARPRVRRRRVPAVGEAPRARAGRQPAGSAARRHLDVVVDERAHQDARRSQARRVHQEDRLSRQAGRTTRRSPIPAGATVCGRRAGGAPLERRPHDRAHRHADRSRTLGNDASDGQRRITTRRTTRSCSRPGSWSRRSSTRSPTTP